MIEVLQGQRLLDIQHLTWYFGEGNEFGMLMGVLHW